MNDKLLLKNLVHKFTKITYFFYKYISVITTKQFISPSPVKHTFTFSDANLDKIEVGICELSENGSSYISTIF